MHLDLRSSPHAAVPTPRAAGRASGIGRLVRGKALGLLDRVLLAVVKPGRRDGEVMVVRLDAIGDFVLWLDAAREFRRLFPGKKLVLFANAVWAELALRVGFWDEVHPVDIALLEHRWRYRYRLMKTIRRRGFEIAVQPTFSRTRGTGDTLIRASGAPERIGSAGDLSNRDQRRSDAWYTRLVEASDRPMHEIARNAEFVTRLANVAFPPSIARMPVLGRLPAALRIDEAYRVVAPGASAAFRRWPAERFAQTINALQVRSPRVTVLSGSASERSLCEDVARTLVGPVVNLAGRMALWELVEVIRGAELLIGNDTSTAHIAAAVGTPSISVVGGGHYGRFLPYTAPLDDPAAPRVVTHEMPCFGCNWRCTQPHPADEPVPCINLVPVADVVRTSDRLLAA